MRGYKDIAIYRRLLRQAKPYRLHLVAVLLLSLLYAPLTLLTPLPLKIVVDSVVGSVPVPAFLQQFLPVDPSRTMLLWLCAGLVVVIALLQGLQILGGWILETYIGERLVLDFRALMFRHTQRLSLSYHDRVGTADSLYRIQHDAPSIQYIAIWGIIPFITASVTLAGVFYVTARIDLQLVLVALAIAPILFLLIGVSRGSLRDGWSKVKEYESAALSVVQEVLGSIRVVKAFGQEEKEQQRFVAHARQGMRGHVRLAILGGSFHLLVGATIALGTATVLFVGVRHVQTGVITLGELLVVMAYLAQMYGPLETISKNIGSLQSSLAGAERVFAVLDSLPEVGERANARPLRRAEGSVSFQNVSFTYDGRQFALHDVSFEINPGTSVGIAGTTGAGKTTLVSLLMRFYDPTRGTVLLDGIDLRDYRLSDLRSQFAIVLQEPVLFSTTIAENIAYGRPGASQEEIVKAAKAANAHDFITRLPDGYHSRVGERGMLLSGGERQRVSLARAFLKDAPLLILDEPTSSVDVKTEAAIIDAMGRLMQGRTTFMIAHRLSTLRRCDLRLNVEHGQLVEAHEHPDDSLLESTYSVKDQAFGGGTQ